jgi:hypothetical protein
MKVVWLALIVAGFWPLVMVVEALASMIRRQIALCFQEGLPHGRQMGEPLHAGPVSRQEAPSGWRGGRLPVADAHPSSADVEAPSMTALAGCDWTCGPAARRGPARPLAEWRDDLAGDLSSHGDVSAAGRQSDL